MKSYPVVTCWDFFIPSSRKIDYPVGKQLFDSRASLCDCPIASDWMCLNDKISLHQNADVPNVKNCKDQIAIANQDRALLGKGFATILKMPQLGHYQNMKGRGDVSQ